METENNIETACGMEFIRSSDLMDMRFDRADWIVNGLLKPGLTILAGSPKVGKSWLVLQLCLCVAKGEPFWGMPVLKSTVAYVSLEDSYVRLQQRIARITEETPDTFEVSLKCPVLGDDLMRGIASFCTSRPETKLFVFDTFQKIREQSGQMSYANDYAEVSFLKKIADELGICILLVHHTRKMSDSDYINEISGTNGIAGSADTLMILKKKKRTGSRATLSCTGRDIGDRRLTLTMDRDTCLWRLTNDTDPPASQELPELMKRLTAFAGKLGSFNGTNTEFCTLFGKYCGESILPNQLKRMMNRYRYELEDAGVFFISARESGGKRRFALYYKEPQDAVKPPEEEAREEQALWDEAASGREQYDSAPPTDDVPHKEQESFDYGAEALWNMPPLPGDEDAPPVQRSYHDMERDEAGYRPYR